MRTCGVEIKGSEVLLCLLSKEEDVFDIRDIRQTRFTLSNSNDAEQLHKFQFDFKKLLEDYQIDTVAIKQRPHTGKFSGSAVGFKMEAAIQLINNVRVVLLSANDIKEQLKRNPLPIDFESTGLKKFQEHAFISAYVEIMEQTYPRPKNEI
ncbi:DUF3010 family protein [Pseudoalteromonas tunicata]|jgi:hypothetical protein|uniref:DUF3010 domain-containing protein n=1 Tax=Pseudoalteromonas tunicata D2 TaxID=87626 RepID=A4C9T6_9GAMM|nr:DUF3010 family protein [Pseudoalteromonas tunicata]ATC94689.1 hypothetical protein PTUN_a2166 [Pseudoalteromonas tunicata]AXT30408.1 DUF3010 family protein [Pseudoalteromonas tunicata]EAR28144.1 hypothetical protein PTD2_20052 [Pseudoalteromonas tunicata D2]MDP4982266.1 DUF3010 family protein [Pseudoalteromonas tunicata]MDP5211995.1 DUF3010 family protein [Pseudoalteromonas tunicata]